VAEGTAFRLDTVDIAVESGWQFEHTSRIDEFSKDGVVITVHYSADDDIFSLTRSGKRSEDELYGPDSAGKHERLRIWLTGQTSAAVKPAVPPSGFSIEYGQEPDGWTLDEFIAAVEDPTDRVFLTRLLELVAENSRLPRLGQKPPLVFGKRPRGGMFVYPFGRRNPPFSFPVKNGQLMIAGCWNRFPEVKGHPGFAPLAAMLDLDENGPATAVPVAGFDAEEVWEVGEAVSQAINT